MQSKFESFVESVSGTLFGFVLSVIVGYYLYPLFGHQFNVLEVSGLTAIFTVISIGRSYLVRRFFNRRIRGHFRENQMSHLRLDLESTKEIS